MGIDAGFDACFFVYAFATVGGAAMWEAGIADGALIGGAMRFILSGLDVERQGDRYDGSTPNSDCNVVVGVSLEPLRCSKYLVEDYQADIDSESDDHEPLTTNDDEALNPHPFYSAWAHC